MTRNLASIALIAFVLSGTAIADVTDAGAGGFSLVHEVTIAADRAAAWNAAVHEVGSWWNSEHTISGDAGNMRINPVLQGCFCEASDDRTGVVHLLVTSVSTNSMLRLTGGLGPLGLMGVSGNMTWEFFDVEGGTSVRFMYAVGGYSPDGLDEFAEPVDAVIGQALQRLKSYVETGNPEAVRLE